MKERKDLVLYPGPPMLDECRDYYVEVNGARAFVCPVRVSAVPVNELYLGTQRPRAETELAGMVHFDCSGSVTLRVVCGFQVFSARVKPTARAVAVARGAANRGDELTLTIDRPGQYVLEVNGRHRALHIFADPPEEDRPDPADDAVQYVAADEKGSAPRYLEITSPLRLRPGKRTLCFGPGVHHAGLMELESGQSVYLDGGAVVYGCIRAVGQRGIRVYGRGILDGSRFARCCEPSALCNLLFFAACSDVTVEGVTLLDAAVYNLATAVCETLTVRYVKIFSWRKNSDGMDLHNTSHVRIADCFVRCFDDCIALKGQSEFNGQPCGRRPLRDVRVERCTVWCDWGRALEIGAETSGAEMSDVLFRDCDILHFAFVACDVQACGSAPIRRIVFDTIRAEDPIDPLLEPRLLEIFLRPMLWMPAEPLGFVREVTFRRIDYRGLVIAPCRFIGWREGHDVRGVRLEAIRLNGRRMQSGGEALTPVIRNEFAREITLDGVPIPPAQMRLETEEETCSSYLIGNGAFLRDG